MSLTDEDRRRRRAAKRTNERLKLMATALNALAIGLVGAAVIIPAVTSPSTLLEPLRTVWFLVAIALHLGAQFVLGFMRSED